LTAVYVEGPPVITAQPADVAAAVDSSATFRVTAEGVGPLSYQWRFNGADIEGAVSDSYTIASVGEEHAGSYDVVVSSAGGSTTSNPAELTILTAALVNGSFETGFDGWTASGNLSLKTAAPYVPTDGNQLVAFNDGNSLPNAVLAQTFATMPGQTYFLSFDMGLLAYNFNQQRLRVDVTGAGTLLSQSFTIARVGSSLVRWVPINLSFTANSTATTLTFRDTSTTTNSLDLLLDHVEISDQMAAASASAPTPQGNLLAARPSITSIAGSVTIHLATQEHGLYELQRSRDLQSWETVSTISPDPARNFAFIDPGPPEKQMFYRIVLHRGTASK
jgi:hypothetical protein